ncbi:MAG: hypothetical protein HYX94_07730 [Chloroflexi bacterium]|nr:hypothetical protein [Chloroflexota bacterium]
MVAVDNSGRIGIGASQPSRLVHVEGPGTTNSTLPGVRIKCTAAGGEDFSLVAGDLGFGLLDEGNGSYPLLVKGSGEAGAGNVGVGTTQPTQKLDVAGSIAVNGVLAIKSDGGAAKAYYS